MSKLDFFPLYVNDWLSSTRIASMSPAQEGAYIRLLCYAWNAPDCSLPSDPAKLLSLSRLPQAELLDSIVECFEKIDGKLYPSRLRAEKTKAVELYNARVKGGKARAKELKHPKQKKKTKKSTPPAKLEQSSSTPRENRIDLDYKESKDIQAKVTPDIPSIGDQARQAANHFIEQVEKVKGFKPKIDKADMILVTQRVKEYGYEDVAGCIDHYLTTKKADEIGIGLKLCLTAHSINLFLQARDGKQSPEQMAADIVKHLQGGFMLRPSTKQILNDYCTSSKLSIKKLSEEIKTGRWLENDAFNSFKRFIEKAISVPA